MAEPDETRPNRAEIRSFQRERFEEVLNLLNRFANWLVPYGFASEPAAADLDGAVSDFQDRPPRSLEGDRRSGASNGWLQTANRRRAAFAGDPNDEPREAIEPRIKHHDARELENGAERRKRQHAVRIIESRTH